VLELSFICKSLNFVCDSGLRLILQWGMWVVYCREKELGRFGCFSLIGVWDMGEWLLVPNGMGLSFQFCWDEWSCFVVVETKFISDWVVCWTFELVGWSLGLLWLKSSNSCMTMEMGAMGLRLWWGILLVQWVIVGNRDWGIWVFLVKIGNLISFWNVGEWFLVPNGVCLSFQFCCDEWSCFVLVETKFISDWVVYWAFVLERWSLGLWVDVIAWLNCHLLARGLNFLW
jgi:hypothetical protein